jgi:hypothetical protein
LHPERDGPVVDEPDLHLRAEAACGNPAGQLNGVHAPRRRRTVARPVRPGGVREAGPEALARIRSERELRDEQQFPADLRETQRSCGRRCQANTR